MTSYKNLKIEEKEIIEKFKAFLLKVIDAQENYFIDFVAGKDAGEMFYESVEMDKKNLKKARDILDECIWFIQKNEPRANHLRLIIAVINSLNDIKRISNYIVTFSKFCSKQTAEDREILKKEFEPLGKLSIQTVRSLYKLIDEFELETIKEKADIIFEKFIDQYKESYTKSIKGSMKCKNESTKFVINTVVIVKNFDRFVDHTMNIIENLLTIG
ncbi:MAG: PhoU domain-containing protein [Mycoplasma sp.]